MGVKESRAGVSFEGGRQLNQLRSLNMTSAHSGVKERERKARKDREREGAPSSGARDLKEIVHLLFSFFFK